MEQLGGTEPYLEAKKFTIIMHVDRTPLIAPAPGTRRELITYRFNGTERGRLPKVYIQAGLHADEWPGLLVVQHLLPLLQQAESEQRLKAQFVVVPYANPIGMAQNVFGYVTGRFDLTGTGNFNRNFGDLYTPTLKRLQEISQPPSAEQVTEALRLSVAELDAEDEAAALKKQLLELSIDADYVLDLHCDDRTSAHIYGALIQEEAARELTQQLGYDYLFTEDLDGVVAFDGMHLQTRHWLAQDFPDADIPLPRLAVTVELRGQYDVEDDLARMDAHNLYQYFQRQGLIQGEVAAAKTREVRVSPLQAVDAMKAEVAGLLVFSRPLDSDLEKGEVFAEIVQLDADTPNCRHPVRARTSGRLMGLSHRRLVRPGDQIAKIAGLEPLAHRTPGNLLQL